MRRWCGPRMAATCPARVIVAARRRVATSSGLLIDRIFSRTSDGSANVCGACPLRRTFVRAVRGRREPCGPSPNRNRKHNAAVTRPPDTPASVAAVRRSQRRRQLQRRASGFDAEALPVPNFLRAIAFRKNSTQRCSGCCGASTRSASGSWTGQVVKIGILPEWIGRVAVASDRAGRRHESDAAGESRQGAGAPIRIGLHRYASSFRPGKILGCG